MDNYYINLGGNTARRARKCLQRGGLLDVS
jgi:hypothetical protein